MIEKEVRFYDKAKIRFFSEMSEWGNLNKLNIREIENEDL